MGASTGGLVLIPFPQDQEVLKSNREAAIALCAFAATSRAGSGPQILRRKSGVMRPHLWFETPKLLARSSF
jgi:hypothetical protein